MEKISNLLVYEWNAWDGFLVSHLVDEDQRFQASFEDRPDALHSAMTDDIDAVLLQINLSLPSAIPRNRSGFLEYCRSRTILVLNGKVENITKRHLHHLLDDAGITSAKAELAGDPEEALFVKSTLNCGGEPEHRLPASVRDSYQADIAGARIVKHDEYYFARRKHIDRDVWGDNSVVVERYITNPDNSFYRVYGFGDSIIVVTAHSDALIKKLSGCERDTNIMFSRSKIMSADLRLPQNLQSVLVRFLKKIPLQYFCLDIVHDNEQAYIIDLNLTPYSGRSSQNYEVCQFLIEGFGNLLRQTERCH